MAYAVVQRSALAPMLIEPQRALAGTPVRIVGGISAGKGHLAIDPEVLRDATFTAEVQGQSVTLSDGGVKPDATAGDGRFTGTVTFRGSGKVPVRLHVRSPLIDRSVDAASTLPAASATPVRLSTSTSHPQRGSRRLRPLIFTAEHQGEVPF